MTGRFAVCIVFSMAVLISGCAVRKGPEPNARLEDFAARDSRDKMDIKEINERLFASIKGPPNPKDYVLGEGDLLQVAVFEVQDLKAEVRVGARGFITLPLLGAVDVKGLTAREAEEKIERLYNAKYVKNPHVTVFVKEQVSGKITLIGAVKRTGSFPYLTKQNLFETLALAEGLAENAGKMVQVRRMTNDSAKPYTYIVDLNQLVTTGGDEINIEIKSGDVIYVPEAGTVYVDGAVRKPGNYTIKKKMNITEAIVAAGGFAPFADESKIKLVRSKPEGKADIVQLSFKELEEQGSNSIQNIEVEDRDIIFVETSKIEAMIYGIRFSGLGGLYGVGYEPPHPQ